MCQKNLLVRPKCVGNADNPVIKTIDALSVDVMDPLVGRLPDDGPHPQRQVGRHQMDESKPSEQAKSLNDDRWVDKKEMHLQEGEESLLK